MERELTQNAAWHEQEPAGRPGFGPSDPFDKPPLSRILSAVNFDYSKRGYLLPHGCKDLIDVIGQESGDQFVWRIHLPEVASASLIVTVEGRSIRISGKGQKPFETVFEVPMGYDIIQAWATCLNDELRITIPKAAS